MIPTAFSKFGAVIATEFAAAGLPTKRGGRWDAGTVRRVWQARARYAGGASPEVAA